MAIDTLNKRASCIGIDLAWCHVYPKPGTANSANFRAQIGMKYAGTLSASTAVATNIYRCLMGVGG